MFGSSGLRGLGFEGVCSMLLMASYRIWFRVEGLGFGVLGPGVRPYFLF